MIKDDLLDEGNSRLNLATFCQTFMEPEAVKLMNQKSVPSNLPRVDLSFHKAFDYISSIYKKCAFHSD
jgi:hypothetical protein